MRPIDPRTLFTHAVIQRTVAFNFRQGWRLQRPKMEPAAGRETVDIYPAWMR